MLSSVFRLRRPPAQPPAVIAQLRQQQAQETLDEVKKFLGELQPWQRTVILEHAQTIRDFLKDMGYPGVIALTLVAAEVGLQSVSFVARQLDQDGRPQ